LQYNDALAKILQLVDFERMYRVHGMPVRYNLDRIESLMDRLGKPHLGVPTLHIAGTKGKGSIAAMSAAILTHQGFRTGLYTSPHIHTIRERIRLNGVPVSEDEFANLVETVWPAMEAIRSESKNTRVTLFEYLTGMAFTHFNLNKTEFQVVEVGLGGRLDATNIVSPQICVITALSLDHTALLGNTIQQIALEKAGIIKPNSVVVCAPQEPPALETIREVCKQQRARLIEVSREMKWNANKTTLLGQSFSVNGRLGQYDAWIPLLGKHQIENAAVAIGIMEILIEQGNHISYESILGGLETVSWPCRMEVLGQNPLIIVDGAHNPHSAAVLRDAIDEHRTSGQLILLIGVSQDKNIDGIVEELAQLSPKVIATCSRHPRSASTAELTRSFLSHGIEPLEVDSSEQAVSVARDMAGEDDLILATGSLFLAAEVREVIKGITPELYWNPTTSETPQSTADL